MNEIIWLLSVFMSLLFFAFMISVSSNCRKTADEARQQTDLLRQLVQQTRPPAAPGATPTPIASHNYMREPARSPAASILISLLVVGGVILAIALFSRT